MKNCKTCKHEFAYSEFYFQIKKNGNKIYNPNCKSCVKTKVKLWSSLNNEQQVENTKKWREHNRNRMLESMRNYRQENKEEFAIRDRDYYINNKDKIHAYNREYRLRDYVKFIETIRTQTTRKVSRRSKSSLEHLGCSIDYFQKWIEHQFDSNMTWDNYGKYWNYDHVFPCSRYKEYTNTFCWKNLRPYEIKKNSSKNNKIISYEIVLQELKSYIYNKATSTNCGKFLKT
jgi:hypothetical protein